MKRLLTALAIVLALPLTVSAQYKVAILETVDKAQELRYGLKLLVRSSLTTAISNTPGYEGYDRVDLASISSEQEFQRTGNVSNSQIKQIGEATGAAYVLVAEAAKYDETTIIITAKIIDVETFGIMSSAEEMSGTAPKEMKKSCASLASQLLNVPASSSSPTPNPKHSTSENSKAVPTVSQPAIPIGTSSAQSDPNQLTTLADGAAVFVATEDETERLDYGSATKACSCKGAEWRLPTVEELKLMETRKGIYNLNSSYRYWAFGGGTTIDMSTGYKVKTKNSVKAKVRCVKEVK